MTREMIENWIELIKKARALGDWDSSDTARAYLESKGLLIKYKIDGSVEWSVKLDVPRKLRELWCNTVLDDSSKLSVFTDDLEAYARSIPNVYDVRRKNGQVHFNVSCEDIEERKRVMDMIRHDVSLMSKGIGKTSCGEK